MGATRGDRPFDEGIERHGQVVSHGIADHRRAWIKEITQHALIAGIHGPVIAVGGLCDCNPVLNGVRSWSCLPDSVLCVVRKRMSGIDQRPLAPRQVTVMIDHHRNQILE